MITFGITTLTCLAVSALTLVVFKVYVRKCASLTNRLLQMIINFVSLYTFTRQTMIGKLKLVRVNVRTTVGKLLTTNRFNCILTRSNLVFTLFLFTEDVLERIMDHRLVNCFISIFERSCVLALWSSGWCATANGYFCQTL